MKRTSVISLVLSATFLLSAPVQALAGEGTVLPFFAGVGFFQWLFSTNSPEDAPEPQTYIDTAKEGLTDLPWSREEAAYIRAMDTSYVYDMAVALTEIVNSPLGGRTAGSDAEHKAAELLYAEMEAIGLKNVHKDPFPVAKWQFNGASLQIQGEEKRLELYSYASGETGPAGLQGELVYLGKGTKQDYEGIDVTGKIVLVDINQREEWWVTYPTLEAANRGAAAIINSNEGGYAEISDKAYNSQDFCGPVTIPSLNATVEDANYLKDAIEKNGGSIEVNLLVDNKVEENGTSYNIWGEIPGKNPQEVVLVGDHYDVHFLGFQDNSCAVGLTLGIAKAMIDSGYEPERTIRFILHGAEEYGAIDTRYDWSTGAYEQINNVRPDWVGQTLAYINFELPAYEFSDYLYVAATEEMQLFVDDFIESCEAPENVFPLGIYPKATVETAWADNFSYSIAGVPTIHNGFLYDEYGDVFDFYIDYYHSDFDTKETYNEDVLAYNMKFYGAMTIALDRTPYLELDFTLSAASAFNSLGEEGTELRAELDAYLQKASDYSMKIKELNNWYRMALEQPEKNKELLAKLKADAVQANKKTLDLYKNWKDNMIRLTWEDVAIFPHEEAQENVELLRTAVERLKAGELAYVYDELLWQVDGLRAWYPYYFSEQTTDYFRDYVLEPVNEHNYWGTGRITGYAPEIEKLIEICAEKYEEESPDCTEAISLAESILENQKERLAGLLEAERKAVIEMSKGFDEYSLFEER